MRRAPTHTHVGDVPERHEIAPFPSGDDEFLEVLDRGIGTLEAHCELSVGRLNPACR